MKGNSVHLILIFLFFGISSCRKDKIPCSNQNGITIAFGDLKFQFNQGGYPIFWSDDNNDSQIEWEYDQNQFIRSKNGTYYSGLGWNSFSFNWSGDTCIVTVAAEGVPEETDTLIIKANRDVLSHGATLYYYTDNRLDSITSPSLVDVYFEYEADQLISVKNYLHDTGEATDSYHFTYDNTGKLIEEIRLFPSQPLWSIITSYSYNSNEQLSTISQKNYDASGELVQNLQNIKVTQIGCGLPLPMWPINRYKYSYLGMKALIFD